MDDKLRNYLENCSPATVDESLLDDLRREMEEAVPEIAESIRQREELAARLRVSAPTSSHPDADS